MKDDRLRYKYILTVPWIPVIHFFGLNDTGSLFALEWWTLGQYLDHLGPGSFALLSSRYALSSHIISDQVKVIVFGCLCCVLLLIFDDSCQPEKSLYVYLLILILCRV